MTASSLFEKILEQLPDANGPNDSGFYSLRCPYHNDQHPSAWLHPKAGFGCHACGTRKTIRELAKDLNISGGSPPPSKTLVRNKEKALFSPHLPLLRTSVSEPEQLSREDIAEFIKEFYQFEKADRFKNCGERFSKYLCQNCGAPIARAHFCDLPFCEDCRRRHRNQFFRRHKDTLRKGSGVYHVFRWAISTVPFGELRKAIQAKVKALKKIRQAVKGLSGLYGVSYRWTEEGWQVWLTILVKGSDEAYIELYTASVFAYSLPFYDVARFEDLESAWAYFCGLNPFRLVFADKSQLWEIVSDMSSIKLYQGWGEFYRVSGWRGKPEDKNLKCPICGGELKYLEECTSAYVWWDEDEGVALWSDEPCHTPIRSRA